MLDKVWTFLHGDAPKGQCERGHNVMLCKDDVPKVERGVQVNGARCEIYGDPDPPVTSLWRRSGCWLSSQPTPCTTTLR
jgi:hypothetical protein